MYQVNVSNKAKKALVKLPDNIYKRVIKVFSELASEPRPPGCKKLKGRVNAWRIRVSNYRIIYEIEDEKLVVLIISLGHRKDIYN